MKFRPVGARALLRPAEEEEKTASGIVLPQTAKSKPQIARVIAIGGQDDGAVSEGDLVVFARYSGAEINLDGEDHLILNSDDLLGIVEE